MRALTLREHGDPDVLVDRGLLRIHVSLRVGLANVGEAHRWIESGHTIGKIAVVVAPA